MSVNGKTQPVNIVDGYAVIENGLKDGDEIILNLPMEVKRITANKKAEYLKIKLHCKEGPLYFVLKELTRAINMYLIYILLK